MDIIQSYNSDLIPERPKYNSIVTKKHFEKIISEVKNK